MEIPSEGSGASTQGSSSNEYVTADELWMDLETGHGSTCGRDEPRIRVLGIMDAIRNGLYSTFDRSPKSKNAKEGPRSNIAGPPCDVSDANAHYDHHQDNFPQEEGPGLDSNGLVLISEGRCDSVKKASQTIEDNVDRHSKQDWYNIRPDTRTFAARSSSEHTMVTKDSRVKYRNRRQRMTWPIKPCESDSYERMDIETKEHSTFERNGGCDSFDDALMRKKSKSLVSDAVRKALSVVTVENVLLDSLLSYTDLQRGDIRLTSDLVFWTEDVGASFTGDATPETEKSKFVLTPYPKAKLQDANTDRDNRQFDEQTSGSPKWEIDEDSDEDIHKIASDEDCDDDQFFDSSCQLGEDSPETNQAWNKEDDISDGQKNEEDISSDEDVLHEQSIHHETDLPGTDDEVENIPFQIESDPDCTCDTYAEEKVFKCDNDQSNNHVSELRNQSIDTSDCISKQCNECCDGLKKFVGDNFLIENDGCSSSTRKFPNEQDVENDRVSGDRPDLKENFPSAEHHKEEIEAAEEIVRDTMKVARSVVHHVHPKHEVRGQSLSEPQCWEDLLDLDEDDDVISLSDFDMSEIKFIKNELAEMRDTIGEVAQEIIRENDNNCDNKNEIISSQENNKFQQRDQQLVPKEEDNSAEEVDDIRTKITFWEGFMKFGYDGTSAKRPSVAEKADRLVSCKFCKQGPEVSTAEKPNDPHSFYSESCENGRVVAVETEISNFSEGFSYPDAKMDRDEIQTMNAHLSASHQEPVSPNESRMANTELHCENLTQEETEEESTLPKVKTRISIWEKLPFRKGHLKKKTADSVDLNASTKEKVAFFEKISTPQSPFSRRSSSRFSFMKDDWLQRFRRKHDESTMTDSTTFEDSSLIQQPGGSYDSGVWTNAAFFDDSLLESIDDAMREKQLEGMNQEKSNGVAQVREDHEGLSKEKEFESPCHSDDNDDSEWSVAVTEETKSKVTPLTGQSQRTMHAVSPEESETVMDSESNDFTSLKTVKDNNNEKSSIENISYCSLKEESNNMSLLSDGHEFFLEVIGEKPVDVVEDTALRDEQQEDGPSLEIVGSAMKLHEIPELDSKDVDTKPDGNLKKKNKLLAIFSHRKNSKKEPVASKSAKKLKVEEKGEGDMMDDLDRKIAKKCKKKRTKDWGYVDLEPTGQVKPKKRWKLFRKT